MASSGSGTSGGFIKDPDTGRRRALRRPAEEWIRQEHPEFRIIDADLWAAVQERVAFVEKTCGVGPARPLGATIQVGQAVTSNRNSTGLFAGKALRAPATTRIKGLRWRLSPSSGPPPSNRSQIGAFTTERSGCS